MSSSIVDKNRTCLLQKYHAIKQSLIVSNYLFNPEQSPIEKALYHNQFVVCCGIASFYYHLVRK